MSRFKLIISLLGTFAMLYVMNKTGEPLKTAATPLGIINLEFASNQQKVDNILQAWEPNDLLHVAGTNTYWDFLFLFFYGWLLFNLCKLIYQKFPEGYGKFGLFLSRLAVLAAFFDVIENGFMLGVLHHSYTATGLLMMVSSSALKWGLVITVVLYSLIGLAWIGLKAISIKRTP
jgi:hypothetical protein